MTKAKVLFFSTLTPDIISLVLSFAPPECDVEAYSGEVSEESKIDLVRSADFLLIHPGSISDRLLKEAKGVKLIQLLSAGYDKVNLKLAQELGIPVANNGGANSVAVAEHTILLILAVYRKLKTYLKEVNQGRWPRTHIVTADTYELECKTIGLVGLGNIGYRVAKRLQSFDTNIQYFDPYLAVDDPKIQQLEMKSVSLEELLTTSDVVSVHTPLSQKTRHLICAREFSMMKPSSILINTSRGPIVDQDALYEALSTKSIAGAGLDVLEHEPPKYSDPIFGLENVIITPHVAGPTYESFIKRSRNVFSNIKRVLENQQPLWVPYLT